MLNTILGSIFWPQLGAFVQIDRVLLVRIVELVALVPIVAERIRKYFASGIDGTTRDRLVSRQVRRFQFGPRKYNIHIKFICSWRNKLVRPTSDPCPKS